MVREDTFLSTTYTCYDSVFLYENGKSSNLNLPSSLQKYIYLFPLTEGPAGLVGDMVVTFMNGTINGMNKS